MRALFIPILLSCVCLVSSATNACTQQSFKQMFAPEPVCDKCDFTSFYDEKPGCPDNVAKAVANFGRTCFGIKAEKAFKYNRYNELNFICPQRSIFVMTTDPPFPDNRIFADYDFYHFEISCRNLASNEWVIRSKWMPNNTYILRSFRCYNVGYDKCDIRAFYDHLSYPYPLPNEMLKTHHNIPADQAFFIDSDEGVTRAQFNCPPGSFFRLTTNPPLVEKNRIHPQSKYHADKYSIFCNNAAPFEWKIRMGDMPSEERVLKTLTCFNKVPCDNCPPIPMGNVVTDCKKGYKCSAYSELTAGVQLIDGCLSPTLPCNTTHYAINIGADKERVLVPKGRLQIPNIRCIDGKFLFTDILTQAFERPMLRAVCADELPR